MILKRVVMKRIAIISTMFFLISICFIQPAGAQEKTKEEKERELRIKEEIVQQKKAIEEAVKEQESVMEDQRIEMERALKEAQDQIKEADGYKDRARVYRSVGDRAFFNGEPFIFSPEMGDWVGHSFNSDNERTTWDFSKSIKENSFSRDYVFDVETTVKTVVMSVNGDCKAGEIRIKIVMPNGKTYSDIVLDEFGNLNWRKSFTISEEENKDKAGPWKFQINASKASGFFKISLQTY